jgi:hypothetical protein
MSKELAVIREDKIPQYVIREMEHRIKMHQDREQIKVGLLKKFHEQGFTSSMYDRWLTGNVDKLAEKMLEWMIDDLSWQTVKNLKEFLVHEDVKVRMEATKIMANTMKEFKGDRMMSKGINITFNLDGYRAGTESAKKATRSIIDAI